IHAQQIHQLRAPPLRLRARQVDLVQHRDDLEPRVQREEQVGQRLRLHALARVHHQHRALARGERTRDLVREVHVTRRVDQVELVLFAISGAVVHAHCVQLDGDAALALEVVAVEHLLLHLALRQRAGTLEQAVGQRRLAVVDVGDDAEVANPIYAHASGIPVNLRSKPRLKSNRGDGRNQSANRRFSPFFAPSELTGDARAAIFRRAASLPEFPPVDPLPSRLETRRVWYPRPRASIPLLALLWCTSVPAAAQLAPTPRAAGFAGAYIALARGSEAADWNPANLALPGQPRWSVSFPNLALTGAANGPPLGELRALLRDDLSDAERQAFLDLVPETGLDFRGDIQVPWIGASIGRFAFGISSTALVDVHAARELVDMYLEARQNGGLDPERL